MQNMKDRIKGIANELLIATLYVALTYTITVLIMR